MIYLITVEKIKTSEAFLFFIKKLKARTIEIGQHLSGRNFKKECSALCLKTEKQTCILK